VNKKKQKDFVTWWRTDPLPVTPLAKVFASFFKKDAPFLQRNSFQPCPLASVRRPPSLNRVQAFLDMARRIEG